MGDKIKTLSQAIRLGATFRPQCRESYFFHHEGRIISSCAIGAAIEAVTGEALISNIILRDLMDKRFGVEAKIENEIVNMNDKQGMTREAIADWLEAQDL